MVSSTGEVKSLDREVVTSKGIVRRLKGRTLKPGLSDGYLSINILSQGKQVSWRVHLLVAAAFIGPRPRGLDVCHKNDIRTDNRVCNLKYGSRSENMQDVFTNGIRPKRFSKYTGVSKATRCKDRPYKATVTGSKRRTIHIGNFATELEAAKARNAFIKEQGLNSALCKI
jgi:hypothetical protein